MLTFDDKWILIQGTYVARGGEKFMYLGNASPPKFEAYQIKLKKGKLKKTRRNDPNNTRFDGRSFFVDDVSVRLISSNSAPK